MNNDRYYFDRAIAVAREAFERGDDGFGSILVDAEGNILMEAGNEAMTGGNPLAHDTITLVSRAAKKFPREVLEQCTIYAVLEPCVMCTASAFWAGINKIKFAMAESDFEKLLPGGLSISSREFAQRAPREFTSIGPHDDIVEARQVVTDWVNKLLGK